MEAAWTKALSPTFSRGAVEGAPELHAQRLELAVPQRSFDVAAYQKSVRKIIYTTLRADTIEPLLGLGE